MRQGEVKDDTCRLEDFTVTVKARERVVDLK
jgi:hypothetical protein